MAAQVHNTGTPPSEQLKTAYKKLTAAPADFLRQYLVSPAGKGPGAESSMQEKFQLHFKYSSDTKPQVYQIAPGHSRSDAFHFEAAFLKTCKVKTLPTGTFNIPETFTFTSPPEGELLIITGQLSGCTVCWSKVNNHLVMAHCQPGPSMDGETLHKEIKLHGRINNQPPQGCFGPLDYFTNHQGYAHVFGVWYPQHEAWHLYEQTKGPKDTVAASRPLLEA